MVLVNHLGGDESYVGGDTRGGGAQDNVSYNNSTVGEEKGAALVRVLEHGQAAGSERYDGNYFVDDDFFLQHQQNVEVVRTVDENAWENGRNGVCIGGDAEGKNDTAQMIVL